MIDDVDRTAALSFTKRRFDRFDKTGTVVFFDDETIQDNVERLRFMESKLFGLM